MVTSRLTGADREEMVKRFTKNYPGVALHSSVLPALGFFAVGEITVRHQILGLGSLAAHLKYQKIRHWMRNPEKHPENVIMPKSLPKQLDSAVMSGLGLAGGAAQGIPTFVCEDPYLHILQFWASSKLDGVCGKLCGALQPPTGSWIPSCQIPRS